MIDTTNRFLVAARGNEIVIMNLQRGAMSKEAALNLAAWLVALADDDNTFDQVRLAVENT